MTVNRLLFQKNLPLQHLVSAYDDKRQQKRVVEF